VITANQPKTDTDHVCQYCHRKFQRETSLVVHVCAAKKRYQEQNDTGVQLGLQAYLKFYKITQGSAKLKTFDDFAESSYYTAFVKFGRYCQSIRAVNVSQFIEWVINKNKKIDHWCSDKVYEEYLIEHLRVESVIDALTRAIEFSVEWGDREQYPAHDFLRYGNTNAICYAVTVGKISAWIIYNCESGQRFLETLNSEQLTMLWPYIDADFWQKKFKEYLADQEYAKHILTKAGW